MKRLTLLILILGLPVIVEAQSTIITATVTDSDGTLWANGTAQITFVPNASIPNPNIYRFGGAALLPSITNQGPVTLGAGGTLSFTVYDNSLITPIGSQWKLQVCPNASAPCGSIIFSAVGAGTSVSSQLTAVIKAPRFLATAGSYGYNDTEATLQTIPGSTYFNVSSACQRYFTGGVWGCNNLISTPLTIPTGGTNATTAPQALYNLGAATSASPVSQINIDDIADNTYNGLTGWKPVCILPGCNPGGTNAPTSTSHTINNASPSLDGASAFLSETTAAVSTQTNALWSYFANPCDSCQQLISDFQVNIGANGAAASSFEFDAYNFDKADGRNCMLGLQCNQRTGFWQYANQTSAWTNTTLPCSLSYSVWHHIVVNDTCGSTQTWNSITIDGVTTNWNLTLPSTPLPLNYVSDTGLQFQIDIDTTSSAQTVTENLDSVSFQANNPTSSLHAINDVSIVQPSTQAMAGPLTVPTVTTGNINNCLWVDGTKYAQTNAGIQAAITAAGINGCIYLPPATYALTATVGQQILITTPVRIFGGGWNANLQQQNSAAIPVIRIAPSSFSGYVAYGITLSDFQISTSVPLAGTYGIEVDTITAGSVSRMLWDNLWIGCTNAGTFSCAYGTGFGSGAFAFLNPSGTGGLFLSTIKNSIFYGGCSITRAGDMIDFHHNQFLENVDADVCSMDFTAGSTSIAFDHNFVRIGFHFGANTQMMQIDHNEFEPDGQGFAGHHLIGSNSSMLDFDGAVGALVTGVNVVNNSFQINANSSTLNSIRINYGTQINIGGAGQPNDFFLSTGGSCAVATCHAVITTAGISFENRIYHNLYNGSTWTAILDDLAGNTRTMEDTSFDPSKPIFSTAGVYGSFGLAFEPFGNVNNVTDGTSTGNITATYGQGVPPSLPVAGTRETTYQANMTSLAPKDAGNCTMTAGVCTAQSLSHTYTNAPLCFGNSNGTGTQAGILTFPSTTTTVTPTSSVNTDTAHINWFCVCSASGC